MDSALTIAIITILGSGVFAGVATFGLNFWRAELDFRRAKIEELYAAVHKYTKELRIILKRIGGDRLVVDEGSLAMIENVDRINLIIDLYFRPLLPTFNQFKSTIQTFIACEYKRRDNPKEFKQGYLLIVEQGEKLKVKVVALSRQGSLRALIEAVKDSDQLVPPHYPGLNRNG